MHFSCLFFLLNQVYRFLFIQKHSPYISSVVNAHAHILNTQVTCFSSAPSSTPSAPSSSPHLATCLDNVSVVCSPASNKRVRRRHPRALRPAPCSTKKKKNPFSKSMDALFICEASCPRELVCINTSWGLMKASGGLRTPSFSVLSARPKPHQAICCAQ